MSTVFEQTAGEPTTITRKRFQKGTEVSPQEVAHIVGLNGSGKADEWTRFLAKGPDITYDIFTYQKFAKSQKRLFLVWIKVKDCPAELRLVEVGTSIPDTVEDVEVFMSSDEARLPVWKQRVIACMQTPPIEDLPPRSYPSTEPKHAPLQDKKGHKKNGHQFYLPRKGAVPSVGGRNGLKVK